jgi:hypothetical protein
MSKCSQIVFDNLTRRERKCKKKFNFVIQNCKFCHLHANIHYKKYVTKIQALFRGYKQRRMLKYFKTMPCDIQSKIVGIIKDEHHVIKYNQRLSNFLLKKLLKEISEITRNYDIKSQSYLQRHILLNNLFVKSFKLILLYKKYKKIINLNPQFKKILCKDYFGEYNISYFINMLTVCLTNIVKMEDEYLIQTLINKGINYHELINTIN